VILDITVYKAQVLQPLQMVHEEINVIMDLIA
jgi:hypothetical protein